MRSTCVCVCVEMYVCSAPPGKYASAVRIARALLFIVTECVVVFTANTRTCERRGSIARARAYAFKKGTLPKWRALERSRF